jgi:hypothetical protein
MQSAPPERLEELRIKARACSEALPAISSYGVDVSGTSRPSPRIATPDDPLGRRLP